MSMNQEEREIIEYRPRIGLDRVIFTRIIKDANSSSSRVYEPTTSIVERSKTFKADVVIHLLSAMDRVNKLRSKLENRLRYDPVFIAYQKADEEDAVVIYEEALMDVEQNPDFDLYPIAVDLQTQIDAYIDTVIEFLYDDPMYEDFVNAVRADQAASKKAANENSRKESSSSLNPIAAGDDRISTTSPVLTGRDRTPTDDDFTDRPYSQTIIDDIRAQEEQQIETWLDAEVEDLTFNTKPSFTDQQLELIRRAIDDPDTGIDSIQDYIEMIRLEHKSKGSPRVPYTQMIDETRTIHVLYEKAAFFNRAVGVLDSVADETLSNYVNEDIDGTIAYVLEKKDIVADMRELTEMAHRYQSKELRNLIWQMGRVGDPDLWSYIDKKLKEVYDKKRHFINKVKQQYRSRESVNPGANAMVQKLNDGVRAVNHLWMFTLTEHLSVSRQNVEQFTELQLLLTGKRSQQLLYRYYQKAGKELSPGSSNADRFKKSLKNDIYLQ